MKEAVNIPQIMIVFLASLFVALLPTFFFLYLATLLIATLVFVIILMADLVTKKQWRRKSGLIVATMYIVAIIATGIFYCIHSFK